MARRTRNGLVFRVESMPRVLIPKREWVRYLTPDGTLTDESGWPLHSDLDEKLRSAGFERHRPIECDFVPGTSTLRFRQFSDA